MCRDYAVQKGNAKKGKGLMAGKWGPLLEWCIGKYGVQSQGVVIGVALHTYCMPHNVNYFYHRSVSLGVLNIFYAVRSW
jgi:hypothetical protein